MELENRVASGRCVPATFGRACRYDYQEGRSHTRRRLSRQLDLRTTERQRQEVEDLEDYVVVRPRRYRAQARSRRTRAQRACSRASAGVQRSCVLISSTRRPSDDVGGLFLFFELTISLSLRSGSALCPVAEEALGRQELEHRRDGSATIQAQIHHRQALLAPHRSVGFLGACAASCSCLQEEPPSSNPLAHKKSISHTPYGADIDRRSHKCSSRGRDRKTSTLPRHRLRFAPFPDR